MDSDLLYAVLNNGNIQSVTGTGTTVASEYGSGDGTTPGRKRYPRPGIVWMQLPPERSASRIRRSVEHWAAAFRRVR